MWSKLILSISVAVGSFQLLSCATGESKNRTMNDNTKLTAFAGGSLHESETDTATFGAGCFWCVEAIFQQVDGVLKVSSGYCGGHVINPTYEEVFTKKKGHAEVGQIIF